MRTRTPPVSPGRWAFHPPRRPHLTRLPGLYLLASRQGRDRFARALFLANTALPVALLLVITAALLLRSLPILQAQTPAEIIFGRTWKPLQGHFGLFPFLAGTFWVTLAGMALAVPPCLLTAIYLSEYARARLANTIKPLIDLLAGIPSVVYGVWGVVAIVPLVQDLRLFSDRWLGRVPFLHSDNPTGYSVLAGGIILAVMVAPFIIAVTYEVMRATPAGLREASLALGATRWQTIHRALLPRVLPGIIAGVVLGASRALGETMAVLMVVGNVVKIPASPFDPAYPLPALIANNYGEMMSIPRYDAALMAAALLLLVVVLVFNVLSTLVLRRIVGKAWV